MTTTTQPAAPVSSVSTGQELRSMLLIFVLPHLDGRQDLRSATTDSR